MQNTISVTYTWADNTYIYFRLFYHVAKFTKPSEQFIGQYQQEGIPAIQRAARRFNQSRLHVTTTFHPEKSYILYRVLQYKIS